MKVDPQEFKPDVHAGFAKYRPLTPIIDAGDGLLVLIRHADVERMMNDATTRQVEIDILSVRGVSGGALQRFFSNSLLTSNPPDHARRRGSVSRAFAFKLIQAWRPRIHNVVLDLLAKCEQSGNFDFVETVASPLPARIIAEILGIPEQEAPYFASRVYGMSRGLSNFRPHEVEDINSAAIDLMSFVEKLLNERRFRPRDDFLTDYLKAVSESGALSETETLIQIVTLILGGSDTTRFQLTALISLLLQHREQWELVCENPDRVADAVREVMRFEPAIGSVGRVVTCPTRIDGVELEPGNVLSLSICSAQRDETVYSHAHRFNITRGDHPKWSISFGMGPHRCLGEALARAELEEALIVITQRLPNLNLAGDPAKPKGYSGIRSIGPLILRAAA